MKPARSFSFFVRVIRRRQRAIEEYVLGIPPGGDNRRQQANQVQAHVDEMWPGLDDPTVFSPVPAWTSGVSSFSPFFPRLGRRDGRPTVPHLAVGGLLRHATPILTNHHHCQYYYQIYVKKYNHESSHPLLRVGSSSTFLYSWVWPSPSFFFF